MALVAVEPKLSFPSSVDEPALLNRTDAGYLVARRRRNEEWRIEENWEFRVENEELGEKLSRCE